MRNVQCSFLQYSNIIKESSNIIVTKIIRIKLNRKEKSAKFTKLQYYENIQEIMDTRFY